MSASIFSLYFAENLYESTNKGNNKTKCVSFLLNEPQQIKSMTKD